MAQNPNDFFRRRPFRHAFHDPFADLRRWPFDDRIMRQPATGAAARGGEGPMINLWVGEHSAVAVAELPGVSPDQIDIQVFEDELTISGAAPAAPEGDSVWRLRERRAGPFSRTVKLPFRADADHVSARMRDGVLDVTVQRSSADRPRKITVTTA